MLIRVKKTNFSRNFGEIPCYELLFGRKDCPTSPTTTAIQEFPKPTMTSAQNFDYFKRIFNFNEYEVSCSQIHQHFTHSFCPNFLAPKKFKPTI